MSELLQDPSQPKEPSQGASRADIALDITALMPAGVPMPQPTRGNQVQDNAPIKFPTGALSLEQLVAIFSTMPVDLTFIDADDRVRFFSEGPDRVFIRPKSIIGRKVQQCHPAKSVHLVEEILTDFKSGARSAVDFWLNFEGKFVLVRYFALRGEEGQYMGTLEVTQDLTRERQLTGERRLIPKSR